MPLWGSNYLLLNLFVARICFPFIPSSLVSARSLNSLSFSHCFTSLNIQSLLLQPLPHLPQYTIITPLTTAVPPPLNLQSFLLNHCSTPLNIRSLHLRPLQYLPQYTIITPSTTAVPPSIYNHYTFNHCSTPFKIYNLYSFNHYSTSLNIQSLLLQPLQYLPQYTIFTPSTTAVPPSLYLAVDRMSMNTSGVLWMSKFRFSSENTIAIQKNIAVLGKGNRMLMLLGEPSEKTDILSRHVHWGGGVKTFVR